MRLLKKSVTAEGAVEVKVQVSTSEDLWHLYNLVLPGDQVRTNTRRKVVKETSIGSQAAEVRTITLQLQVRNTEFSPDELRVQGVNVKENECVKLGAHHTLSVHAFPPQDVVILKDEWNDVFAARLKEACDNESRADTVAVLMNSGTASVLLVTPSFMYTKAKIEVSIAKKHKNDGTARDRSIQRFFKQVLDALCMHVDFDKAKLILICSPAHVREEFKAYVEAAMAHSEAMAMRNLRKNFSKIVLIKVRDNTNDALREAFADPNIANQMESTRCRDEIKVWQDFQKTMDEDPDRCVYTPQMVYRAAMLGAVGKLMVSDVVFRSEDPTVRRFYLSLIHFVRQGGGGVSVFSSNHVTGEQLTQLGFVAAILHFPCDELDDLEVVENFIDSEEAATFIRENAAASVVV
ncbi:eukaryotic peptide chain release factor subunit 1, putative [Trypanosoma equiperdum]|uniref:Protein pelota homolog n=1 Tax=Trypanosoma equiperdum TaxID=5694 RepID=A0A1G4IHM4_TRYEQ|nr:eukaryotic peptide chain release factor subunit 1, putative [Trypanosoma equiperdum]